LAQAKQQKGKLDGSCRGLWLDLWRWAVDSSFINPCFSQNPSADLHELPSNQLKLIKHAVLVAESDKYSYVGEVSNFNTRRANFIAKLLCRVIINL
jgi:hypothetical protein